MYLFIYLYHLEKLKVVCSLEKLEFKQKQIKCALLNIDVSSRVKWVIN